jgi:hypothetical protein
VVELAGHWSHCGRLLSMTNKVWSCCHICRCVLWNVCTLCLEPAQLNPIRWSGARIARLLSHSQCAFFRPSTTPPPPTLACCLHLYAKGGALRRLRIMTIRGVFHFAIYEARND